MERKLKALREVHGAIHEWSADRKRDLFYYNAYSKSKKYMRGIEQQENYPVDFVVTWVDGNDPEWLKEKEKYSNKLCENEDNAKARFREWGTFRYWFRAVEKNAPWVRFVYLVTYGHLPEWLNIDSTKLKIVKHTDFIPQEYLPTFSSHTIEWNIWRIPGLSEHFIYFNDDMYLINPLSKSDFFKNGLPKYTAVAQPLITYSKMAAHRHARFNNLGLINSAFDIRSCMKQNAEKWFNAQYGKQIKYNKLAYEDGYISGMHYHHVGMPYRKSAMQDFEKKFSSRIHETCMNRFRTSDDIMHQAVQMWEMFNGSFEPVGPNYYGKFISPTTKNLNEVLESISGSERMLCINDHQGVSDSEFELIRNAIIKKLNDKFPEMSSFEI